WRGRSESCWIRKRGTRMQSSPKICEPYDQGIQSSENMNKPTDACRILYVEDDPTSSRLVKMIAEKEGYAVALAGNEREFTKLVAEDPPGLFLIDLTLPDASGLDLLGRMREKYPAIPAIVVTASDSI